MQLDPLSKDSEKAVSGNPDFMINPVWTSKKSGQQEVK